jgi:hypothetical protein
MSLRIVLSFVLWSATENREARRESRSGGRERPPLRSYPWILTLPPPSGSLPLS